MLRGTYAKGSGFPAFLTSPRAFCNKTSSFSINAICLTRNKISFIFHNNVLFNTVKDVKNAIHIFLL